MLEKLNEKEESQNSLKKQWIPTVYVTLKKIFL